MAQYHFSDNVLIAPAPAIALHHHQLANSLALKCHILLPRVYRNTHIYSCLAKAALRWCCWKPDVFFPFLPKNVQEECKKKRKHRFGAK